MTERETEVGTMFHSFHFCLHVVFKQTLPKTNRSFSPCFILCRVLLRDAVRCSVCVCVRSAEQSERPLILSHL